MIERCGAAGPRSVTARVAAVIRSVAAGPGRSLTDVARSAALPVSTTHRLLADLVDAQLLQRGPEGRYRIGSASGPVLGLPGVPVAAGVLTGETALDRVAAVRTHVTAALDDLASITGLRARFGVWRAGGVSCLERSGGRGPGVCMSGLRLLPVHATAVGRALLAHAPPAEVRRVLAGRLPAYTDDTVTSADGLAAALTAVRVNGVAVVRREWRTDESAIAVPVFGPAGVVAALELAGETPTFATLTAGRTLPLTAAAPALVVAARALARRLADDPVVLPSGTGPAPLIWPVDPTAPTSSLHAATGSTA